MNPLLLLPATDLAAVTAEVALLSRVDHKYVVDRETLAALLERLAGGGTAAVLEIDGRRTFRYRSVYFDTPGLDAFLATARRRPQRCKVRTRTYVDTATSWLEVKRRDRCGRTVKHRVATGDPFVLEPSDRAFLAAVDGPVPPADRLSPVLTTTYLRSTLVVGSTRVTIDHEVRGAAPDGRIASIDGHVVETKCDRPGGLVDRVLWQLGVRPLPLSKYGTAMAALRPELPANRWHRTLARHVVLDEPACAERPDPLSTSAAVRGRAPRRS